MYFNDVCKKVVNDKQYLYIKQNGDMTIETSTKRKKGFIMLDLFTASICLQIYNAINPKNQEIFKLLPVNKIINFCLSKAG